VIDVGGEAFSDRVEQVQSYNGRFIHCHFARLAFSKAHLVAIADDRTHKPFVVSILALPWLL
jgi:hypothetical protein